MRRCEGNVLRAFIVLLMLFLGACEGNPEIVSIKIVPGDTILLAGSELQLDIEARGVYGEDLGSPAWVQPLWSWISSGSEQGIAMTSSGYVRALSYGEATITVMVDDLTAMTTLRVNPPIDMRARAVYINQANQNPKDPIPLVADREGLFRLLVVVDEDHYYEGVPEARVTFSTGLDTVLTQAHPLIRDTYAERSLDYSYNLLIPREHVQPGLSAVITYDPADEFDGLGGEERVSFEVLEGPVYRQMVVPFISRPHRRPQITEWARNFTYESNEARELRTFLPISESRTEIIIHETVETNANLNSREGWHQWIQEVSMMRVAEGNPNHYYYGVQHLPYTRGLVGMGYVGNLPVSVGANAGDVMAHEVTHNMGIGHAPCGVGDPDRRYPYPAGKIGHFGIDLSKMTLIDADTPEQMSYCGGRNEQWVSDYYLGRAFAFRGRTGRDVDEGPVLILWGDLTTQTFQPGFLTTAQPTPADPSGQYLAEGFGPDGERVFAHRFSSAVTAHDVGEHFIIAVPVSPTQAIESVTVSGNGITMTLTDGSVEPLQIEFNRRGEVIAFRRDDVTPTRRNLSLISTGLLTTGR